MAKRKKSGYRMGKKGKGAAMVYDTGRRGGMKSRAKGKGTWVRDLGARRWLRAI